jgi:hypothetical protein
MIRILWKLFEDRWLIIVGACASGFFTSAHADMQPAKITWIAVGISIWLGFGLETLWHWRKGYPDVRLFACAFCFTSLFAGAALSVSNGHLAMTGAQELAVGIIVGELLVVTGTQIFFGKTPRTRDQGSENHTDAAPHHCPENGKRL